VGFRKLEVFFELPRRPVDKREKLPPFESVLGEFPSGFRLMELNGEPKASIGPADRSR